jgi:anti-anti-sigma regulatory factor
MNDAQVNTFDDAGNTLKVVFNGALVVENMALLKEKIDWISSGHSYEKIDIKIIEVSSIDLSFVQLMVVFCNHLDKIGLQYSLQWNVSQDIRHLLKQTGFGKYLEKFG